MKSHPRLLASAFALLATAPAWAQTAEAGKAFDGLWQVHLSCDDARDKAGAVVKGYEFDFAAEVRDGKLRGQRGDPGQPSSLSLAGIIAPDGAALITADGFTGKPDYTFGKMQPASPYHYTMRGQFDAQRGHTERVELRRCVADYVRRS